MKLVKYLYRKLRLKYLKRNEIEGTEIRNYFAKEYNINVGLYSYGCFDINRIPKNTTIGRYCSFANTASIFNGNHGVTYLSTHPYLYNTALAMVPEETIKRTACTIEDDVWVGHNAIILPSVEFIGRGAVIGAGSVVTKNVPPYAIVAGNPAKLIKYRFSKETIEIIESSRWWDWSAEEMRHQINKNTDFVYSPAVEQVRKD